MKRIVLLIALSFATTIGWAQQNLTIISFTNTEDAIAFTDSLSLKANRSYSLHRHGILPGWKYIYNVTYRETEPTKSGSPIELTFRFRIEYEGRNEALEIEGVPTYVFSEVSGKFMDVIPFWLACVEPEANIEELSKKGFYRKEEMVEGHKLRYILRVDGDTVTIDFRKI